MGLLRLGLVGGRTARHAWGNTAGVVGSRGQRRRDLGLRRPRLWPASRTDEVGTHPPRTPRSGAAGGEREPAGAARATARPAESCQAGALRRPPGWPRPAGPARDAARLPLGSPPPLGRAGLGGRLRVAPAEGLGYLGGCWWLGSFPDGRGTSGRRSRGRTRREGGRNPSAEALVGRRAGLRLQTLGQSRVVAAAAPAAPSGSSSGWPKMAALPAQGFLSPSQWAGPQKKGGGCARSQRSPEEGGGDRPGSHAPSSVRPSGVDPPRPRPAPLVLTSEGGGERGLRKRSRVPRLPAELLRKFARCFLRVDSVQNCRS